MVTGIGAIIFLYSAAYFKGHAKLNMLLLLLALFAISMLGLVLADDALTLFVFWEGTTITSFPAGRVSITKNRAHGAMRTAGACWSPEWVVWRLLAALLLLGSEVGSFRLSEMNAAGDLIRSSALYLPIFILVCLGAFTKSAQFPVPLLASGRYGGAHARSALTCTLPQWLKRASTCWLAIDPDAGREPRSGSGR